MEPLLVAVIILSYFTIILIISYFTGRGADNESFFLGNRKSPWYVVAFGMIGASLSGVTFISVPGWVITNHFSYMQMILGYLVGYFVIANVLMPLYYKMRLTSIYTYLDGRFGKSTYKTGASFFLLSRVIGASFRLFLVANVLQLTIFNALNVDFAITVIITIILIYAYTFKGGIKTIIWTDSLQTFLMILSVGLTVYFVSKKLDYDFYTMTESIAAHPWSKIFFFDDWNSEKFFVKQFLSGIFISIVMTGLDQDMMQKNLSCRNLREAKKNMYWFSITLIPVNLLFMSLGLLLVIYAGQIGLELPQLTDDLFPIIATQGYLPSIVGIIFMVGLIAAAFTSADSALTALTTSFTVDILNPKGKSEQQMMRIRKTVHIFVALTLALVIFGFKFINNRSVISSIFTAAGYTYGPLLGMYSFGLFTRLKVKDRWVPLIAIVSPVITYLINIYSTQLFNGYKFSFELLIVNGLITFIGLLLLTKKKQ